MATVLRPNANWDYASSFTINGGSATVHAALSDDNDATFIKRSSATVPASYYAEFGTTTISATTKVTSVNVRARLAIGTNGYVQLSLGTITDRNGREVSYSVPVVYQNTLSIATVDTSLNLTSAPDGTAWTQTHIDNLVVKFTDGGAASGDRASLYELYVDVNVTNQPTVVVTTPTGTVTDTNTVSVNWTYADTDGDEQSAYEIKIFDSATYLATGFSADTSTPIVETGIITSALNGQTLDTSLANNTTYRAYVRVASIAGTSNYFSDWDYEQFALSIDAPAEPTLSASYNSTNGAVTVTIFGRTNVLSANQASLETNTTGWDAVTNCAIAQSGAQYSSGVKSLSLTATATGDMTASTTSGTAFAVTASRKFSATAEFRSAVTARSCAVGIRFLTSAGATISTTFGTAITDSASAWTSTTITATAPVTATKAQVFVKVVTPVTSEVHYIDKIAFHSGDSATFTSGGFGTFTFDVERSDDGGTTYTAIRNSPVSASTAQIATIDDYELPVDTTVLYRAKAKAVI